MLLIDSMKKHLIIFTILFGALMLASPAHAEWTKLVSTSSGNSVYIDFDTAKTPEGYIHYWELIDFAMATETGVLSIKAYYQADCKLLRHKILNATRYQQAMGAGNGDGGIAKNPQWKYPPANSIDELTLKAVCKQ